MLMILAATAVALTDAGGPSPTAIVGRWTNPDRTVIVDLAPCGASLCGTVLWATAQARQDARRGTAQLVGTQILTDLQQDGAVWKGKLFVPDANLHGEGKIELVGADQLKVEGCEFGICKSQLWSRDEGQLPAAQ
ncbi:MAG: DUF2147 domain-containing protein [Bacillota bacterium]